MHWIQKAILRQLIFHSSRRFAELKPEGVEGNLFMYHLRQLMQAGYVIKRGGGYVLSPEGKRYTDRLSLKTLQPRIQPKIVTLLVCQNSRGQWLLYRRKRQPFSGLLGFPNGKIHLEESIKTAAERELKEKTGLSCTLRHRGDAYLTVFQDRELLSQVLCHVFTGKNPSGHLIEQADIGECFWADIKRPVGKEYTPGFKDIYRLVKQAKPGRFFEEFTYRI